MVDTCRRQELLDKIFEVFVTKGVEILAWVVLPNHYHLLVQLPNFNDLSELIRLVHGSTSRQWNIEDSATTNRKVWYSYSDRAIRSERHYYTTLNYIHYNPVKHLWVNSPYDYVLSSVHWYLQDRGQEWLRHLWTQYPVRDFGCGWDDI